MPQATHPLLLCWNALTILGNSKEFKGAAMLRLPRYVMEDSPKLQVGPYKVQNTVIWNLEFILIPIALDHGSFQ